MFNSKLDFKAFCILLIVLFSVMEGHAQCDFTLEIPSDITICSSEEIALVGIVNGPYISVEWEGTNGFFDTNLSTQDEPFSNTSYTFTAFSPTNINLVVNGDFENGNTDFTTSYLLGEDFCFFNPFGDLGCEGMYAINTNAINTHVNFSPCTDHTSGNGNFMIVNGSPLAENIWCQDITVKENTDYLFSAWAVSVNSVSPATLQFSINGDLIGTDLDLPSTTCSWQNFTSQWNSGSNSTATICITNQSISFNGNDFGLDDIEFMEICSVEETFSVEFAEVEGQLQTNSVIACYAQEVELSVTPENDNYSYSWEAIGGGEIEGASDLATVVATLDGLYEVTITDENGCTKKLINTVTTQDFPILDIIVDSLTCVQNVGNVTITSTIDNISFAWNGPLGFESDEMSFTTMVPGVYYYTAVTEEGCEILDSIEIISDFSVPSFSMIADTINCFSDQSTIALTSDQEISISNIVTEDLVDQIDLNITVAQAGLTVVTVVGLNGCSTTDTIDVIADFSAPDGFDIGDITINCFQPDSLLLVNLIDDVVAGWVFEGDTIYGEEYLVDEAGEVELILTLASTGCSVKEVLTVMSDFEAEDFSLDGNTINCSQSLSFIELASSQGIHDVSFPSGIVQTDMENYQAFDAGVFVFEVTYTNGCVADAEITVVVDTISPTISAVDKQFSCSKEPLPLEVSSNIAGLTYQWEGPQGFNSEEETPLTAIVGEYFVTITNPLNGCIASTQLSVLANSAFIVPNITIDHPLCFGEQAIVYIGVIDGSSAPYEVEVFHRNGDKVGEDGLLGGEYSVFFEDKFGCDTLIDIIIDSPKDIKVTLDDFLMMKYGDDLQLIAETDLEESAISEIIWEPDEFLSCSDCLNPIIQGLTQDTTLYVTVIDTNGCSKTDSISIRVLIDYDFYVPNTFSPNDDGLNDMFFVQSNTFGENSIIEEMSVFDRWGNNVFYKEDFSPNDSRFAWDGNHNGNKINVGVYSYYIIIRLVTGERRKLVGDLTVVR